MISLTINAVVTVYALTVMALCASLGKCIKDDDTVWWAWVVVEESNHLANHVVSLSCGVVINITGSATFLVIDYPSVGSSDESELATDTER